MRQHIHVGGGIVMQVRFPTGVSSLKLSATNSGLRSRTESLSAIRGSASANGWPDVSNA